MKLGKLSISIFILVTFLVWLSLWQSPSQNLKLVSCDVGEGEATLIVQKNNQILIDGGPNNEVLTCLGKYLPFWDLQIEAVILTHPDRDHYGGLVSVLERYKVNNFFFADSYLSTPLNKVLEKGQGGRQRISKNKKIRLGLIQLDILNPPEERIDQVSGDKNRNSIVSLLTFGSFKAILSGDMDELTSDSLALENSVGQVNYLKVPHHGSRNGLTLNFLTSFKPKIAVISVGKNNYGHPHEEILKMLTDENVAILRTDEKGDVVVFSDGKSYWF